MMKRFFKSKTPYTKPFPEKLANRISKIPTGELDMWIDQTIYELGRCMSQYTKSREAFYLDEALKGAEALHAVVDELHKRMTRP